MKAEHRKELETNTLADKMGHMMGRVKGGQRRTAFLYFIGAFLLLAGLWVGYRWYVGDTQARSMQWIMLYDGSREHMSELLTKDNANTSAGKAARFQIAWIKYWDEGIKMLATNQMGATKSLHFSAEIYRDLAEECKDDPVFEPQALLGLAVTHESLAVQSRANLKKAKEFYQQLKDKHKDSAEARFAVLRLEIMDDETKNRKLGETYAELQRLLRVPPAAGQLNPQFPPGIPLPKKK